MSGLDPRRQKLRDLIAREYTHSPMSDTKWMRVVDGLRPLPPRYRVKLITDSDVSDWSGLAQPPANYIELTGIGPVLFLELEYLEIDSVEKRSRGRLVNEVRVNHFVEVQAILKSARVAYTSDGDIIRIVGHVRRA